MAEKVTETWISTPKRLISAVRDACLVHIYPTGSAMGTRYPLREKPLVVGRGDDCALREAPVRPAATGAETQLARSAAAAAPWGRMHARGWTP